MNKKEAAQLAFTADLAQQWSELHLVRRAGAQKTFVSDVYQPFLEWLAETHPQALEPTYRQFCKILTSIIPSVVKNMTQPRVNQLIIRGWELETPAD